jgi:lipoprotein NlpI
MNVETIYNQGLDKAMLGAYGAAIQDFNQALVMNPDNTEIYHNRGLAHIKLGEYGAAIEDFNEVLKNSSTQTVAQQNQRLLLLTYVNRGLAYHHLLDFLILQQTYELLQPPSGRRPVHIEMTCLHPCVREYQG